MKRYILLLFLALTTATHGADLKLLMDQANKAYAAQEFAKAQRDELISLVQLYKALGGGWQ